MFSPETPNKTEEHRLRPFFQDPGSQVFMEAILAHQVATARAQLAAGLDIDYLQESGFSYLTFCLFLRDLPAFEMLLTLGANPNAVCVEKNALTPLMLAACIPEIGFLQACINAGGKLNALAEDGDSALILATASDNENAVRLLLSAGAEVNHQGAFMASALHEAANQGLQTIAEMLLAAGAKTNLRDENGECANLKTGADKHL